MFDEVTRTGSGRRAARRGAWVLGSAALQGAFLAGLLALSVAHRRRGGAVELVPVKIVRPAAQGVEGSPASRPGPQRVPARRLAPVHPPPPRLAQRRAVVAPASPLPARPPPAQPHPVDPGPAEERLAAGPEEPSGPARPGGGAGTGTGGGTGEAAGGGGLAPGGRSGEPRFDESMTPPLLQSGPPLTYTPQALEQEVEGVMVVECVVTAEGVVRGCRVLKGLPFMDRAVVENLERRRYRPATRGGQPLSVRYVFTIRLDLPR